ncbi:MAG: Ig-like domain-containing protein [Chloroflexota bacterium]
MSKRHLLTVPFSLLLVGTLLLAGSGIALARQGGHDHDHDRGHRFRHPTLVSIAVSPASPSIVAGTDQQLKATGTYSDATTADLTATAAWASSAASATVGTTGLAHGVSAGSSTISATIGLVAGSTVLTVTAAPVPADVTVLGTVVAVFASGDFLLSSGGTTYTVAMSPTTSIVNLLGHIVPSQFIAAGGAVEVTGPLTGATIAAGLVVVQTTIDF